MHEENDFEERKQHLIEPKAAAVANQEAGKAQQQNVVNAP